MSVPSLFNLVHAADYLNIPELFSCGCKKIADLIKGNSMESIEEEINERKKYDKDNQEKRGKTDEDCEEVQTLFNDLNLHK